MTIAEAYAVCREIARREAKNFFYAFRVLPPAKRDAMCAIYAFMRRADDLADDESISLEARREAMAEWLGAWRRARVGAAGDDPVFVAVADAQRRFGIGDELLEELVRGTCMDLDPAPPGAIVVERAPVGGAGGGTIQAYEDFAGLYRYCYLVASVVGLVSIRVFGYSDPAAEKLAEETGVAFQLTNILRDVKEDAERGRVYLPLTDLDEVGVGLDDLLAAAAGSARKPGVARTMQREGERARAFYASAGRLLPMIDADSRAALWVMVTIYRELLERIARAGYPLAPRVTVPTYRKLTILAQGTAMALRLRWMP